MSKRYRNAWDRAVECERRRCRKLGLVWNRPSRDWRHDDYSVNEIFAIGNSDGAIATHKVSKTGRIQRQQDGGIWPHEVWLAQAKQPVSVGKKPSSRSCVVRDEQGNRKGNQA